jgi:Phosphoglycerate dehydrogenase and related dehydrogenases
MDAKRGSLCHGGHNLPKAELWRTDQTQINIFVKQEEKNTMKILSSIKISDDLLKKLLAIRPGAQIVQVRDFTEADPEADVLLTYGWDIKKDTIDLYPSLKWIQTLSAGVDMLPLDRLVSRGVMLANVKGAHKIQMAEHVIWSILMLLRQGNTFVSQQEQKIFSVNPKISEMYGKSVCIVGAGTIGKEIAKRCGAFGMTVYGVSLHGGQDQAFARIVTPEEMPGILSVSDVVVIVLPLTSETKDFVNADFIHQMKDGARFVNVARGQVVDEDALIEALKSKKIAAAALDVFRKEPLPEDSPFWELDNVFLTPHIGGRTIQTSERMWEVFQTNLVKYPDPGQMINIIDYMAGY